jgi:hypothetical protein
MVYVIVALVGGIGGIVTLIQWLSPPKISVSPEEIAISRLMQKGATARFTVTNNYNKTLYQLQVIAEADNPAVTLGPHDIWVYPLSGSSPDLTARFPEVEIDMSQIGLVGKTKDGRFLTMYFLYDIKPGESIRFSVQTIRPPTLGVPGAIRFRVAGFSNEPGVVTLPNKPGVVTLR